MSTTLPPNALEAIPCDTRWTIANALRSAAERYDGFANEAGEKFATLKDQFKLQATEARELAEAFEDC